MISFSEVFGPIPPPPLVGKTAKSGHTCEETGFENNFRHQVNIPLGSEVVGIPPWGTSGKGALAAHWARREISASHKKQEIPVHLSRVQPVTEWMDEERAELLSPTFAVFKHRFP